MDFKEIDINIKNWINSAQDSDYWGSLVNAALNLQITQAIELLNTPLVVSYAMLLWRRYGRIQEMGGQY